MIADNIELSKEDLARLTRKMSHWVGVSKMLYESKDETELLCFLVAELNTRKRYYIIQRIYAHYNSIRRRRELDEIKSWNPKKIPNGTCESTS